MKRKSFLLRLDPGLFEAIERLAQQELRSVNGQVEFLLRQALQSRGRLPPDDSVGPADDVPGLQPSAFGTQSKPVDEHSE